MAYIGHRCANCRHRQDAHTDSRGGPCRQTSRCGCRRYAAGAPSELFRTFGIRGRTLDLIIEPGKPVNPGVRACDCPECRELYERLTDPAQQAAAGPGGGRA